LFVQLVSKIFNLCGHDPDGQTDRQDRQTTCDRKTALCTTVHCAVKICISTMTAKLLEFVCEYSHNISCKFYWNNWCSSTNTAV